MKYDTVNQIEDWDFSWEREHISTENIKFLNSDFEDYITYKNAKTSYEKMIHFFNQTIIFNFWKHFDLLQILTLASMFKMAAYHAYHFNHSGFRDFCEKAWYEKTLDFHVLGTVTENQFILIQKLFPKLDHQIFRSDMPNSFLMYLNPCREFTFKLFCTINPLIRYTPSNFRLNPKLNFEGDSFLSINNHFLDIIQIFPKTKRISFNKFLFGPFQTSVLRALKLKSITINNSVALKNSDVDLGYCILNSKYSLREIHIKSSVEEDSVFKNLAKTVDIILKNIHLFQNLKSLTIPLQITVDNLEKLWNIKKLSKLRSLLIFETQDTEDYDDNLRELIASNLKGDSELAVIFIKRGEYN